MNFIWTLSNCILYTILQFTNVHIINTIKFDSIYIFYIYLMRLRKCFSPSSQPQTFVWRLTFCCFNQAKKNVQISVLKLQAVTFLLCVKCLLFYILLFNPAHYFPCITRNQYRSFNVQNIFYINKTLEILEYWNCTLGKPSLKKKKIVTNVTKGGGVPLTKCYNF